MEEERREEENQRQFGGESHFLDYLGCGCDKIKNNKENLFCALCFVRESEWCRLYMCVCMNIYREEMWAKTLKMVHTVYI